MIQKAIIRSSIFVIIFVFFACTGSSPSGRRVDRKNNDYKTSESHISSDKSSSQSFEINRQNKDSQSNSLSLNQLYNTYKKSVFIVYTSDGDNDFQGSGFFVSKEGLGVSNYHVFEGKSKGLELIKTFDGNTYKINKILEKNKKFDYIIFKVDLGSNDILNPIQINKEDLQIGEDVFAIGNPKGLESTLSKGIISSLRENSKIVQTTAEITNGSSGGPLLNMKGQVIGITTSGLGEANLNFAININLLRLERFIVNRISDSSSKYTYYPIKKFVDGDTFWVDDGSEKGLKIRLIGVDTPETVHPRKPVEYYGREASNYVKEILKNQRIRLEFDVDKTDRYGRILAYVYLEDGTFLNEELVKNGYAQVSTFPPNVKYSKHFLKLERHARENDLGLWKKQ
ncbi:thermonuclease family protein [Psychroflexus sp. CAK57W]|uniref:thermonuclease family protein n=1 Tax=Psychroflexus curvus TaxID=2873595 RepID=UPI001CCD00E3|nr:thermonuclease family protein [Psychroflexus curvus]MBZ9787597.1 thermonuclease family protein [Psychroflexus curvus]